MGKNQCLALYLLSCASATGSLMRSSAVAIAIFCALTTSLNAKESEGTGVFHIAPAPGSTVPAPIHGSEIMDGLVTAFIQETWGEAHGTTYSFDIYGHSDIGILVYAGHQIRNSTSRTWVGLR